MLWSFNLEALFVIGPIARPGARGFGAWPGPHILNCFAGRAGPGHTCCGPGRARAS